MCLRLYDYQSKARRYSNGLTYLKTRVTTNQKHIIDSQKPKRKLKHNRNQQNTKGKTKRTRKEHRRSTKSTGKQGLQWQ